MTNQLRSRPRCALTIALCVLVACLSASMLSPFQYATASADSATASDSNLHSNEAITRLVARLTREDAHDYTSIAFAPSTQSSSSATSTSSSSSDSASLAGSLFSDTFRTSSLRDGLFASRDIASGGEVMRISPNRFMNYSTPIVDDTPLDAHLIDLLLTSVHTGAVLDSQALLAIRLLHQYQSYDSTKNVDSYWNSFLADLPKPTSVCFYTADELSQLQIPNESPVFVSRSHQLDAIHDSYIAFDTIIKSRTNDYSPLFPLGFTESWYRWAYVLVLNTAIEVPTRVYDEEHESESLGALLVLAPLISRMNHANPPYQNTRLEWVDTTPTQAAYLRLVAIKDIHAGDELTLTYGSFTAVPLIQNATTSTATNGDNAHHAAPHIDSAPHDTIGRNSNANATVSHFTLASFFQQVGLSNSQLLLHYGLALPSNEYERIALDIGLETDSPDVEEHHVELIELKRDIIELNDLDHATLVGIDGRIDHYFVQALRTKHLTREDLYHLAALEYEFAPENGYLSLQNELKWSLGLIVNLESLLTHYPTSLEYDLDQLRSLLASRDRTIHERSHMVHVLSHRICLKRIVHAIILRVLHDIHELFIHVSNAWTKTIDQDHTIEKETKRLEQGELASMTTQNERTQLIDEWRTARSDWIRDIGDWRIDVDKWESQWHGWVQSRLSSSDLLPSLPDFGFHEHSTPDSLDDLLDPSIHAYSLEHREEEEDETAAQHQEIEEDEDDAAHDEEMNGHDEL